MACSAAEAPLDGTAETITRKLINKAMEGDAHALRLIFERLLPRRRHRLVDFDLPPIDMAAESLKVSAAVSRQARSGNRRYPEAQDFLNIIDGRELKGSG